MKLPGRESLDRGDVVMEVVLEVFIKSNWSRDQKPTDLINKMTGQARPHHPRSPWVCLSRGRLRLRLEDPTGSNCKTRAQQ